MTLRDHPILLTGTLTSREDLFNALAEIEPGQHQRPTNLDGLADFLRELKAGRIIASDWRIDAADTARISRVLRDLNVRLVR